SFWAVLSGLSATATAGAWPLAAGTTVAPPFARAWHSVNLASAWAGSPPGFDRAVAWANNLPTSAAFGPLAASAALIAGVHSPSFALYSAAGSALLAVSLAGPAFAFSNSASTLSSWAWASSNLPLM